MTCSEQLVNLAFTDGSYFAIRTRLLCNIEVETDYRVTSCIFSDDRAWMKIGDKSTIEISMDQNDLIGPEYYEFRDADGAWIVAN